MVSVGRAARRRPRASGASFDIRIARVVLDGVPAVDQDDLTFEIQTAMFRALTAGPEALRIPLSRNVAFAAGDVVRLGSSTFASQVGDAMAPVVLGAPPPGTSHPRPGQS